MARGELERNIGERSREIFEGTGRAEGDRSLSGSVGRGDLVKSLGLGIADAKNLSVGAGNETGPDPRRIGNRHGKAGHEFRLNVAHAFSAEMNSVPVESAAMSPTAWKAVVSSVMSANLY